MVRYVIICFEFEAGMLEVNRVSVCECVCVKTGSTHYYFHFAFRRGNKML